MGKHKGLKRTPSQNRYHLEHRWISNKIRKLKKHIKRFPKDNTAVKALQSAKNTS